MSWCHSTILRTSLRISHHLRHRFQAQRLLSGVEKANDPFEALTEWIPPERDLGSTIKEKDASQPDWLKTRRKAISMSKPSKTAKFRDGELEVLPKTLLTANEIESTLTAMGGLDFLLLPDDPKQPRMGGPNGIIVITASTISHLQLLADSLVRQLKTRDLDKVGVIGAQLGSEGGDADDTWRVVDCENYVVHIQTEETRKAVALETLWSGTDPIFNINLLDDDEVDDYVSAYPAPKFGKESADFTKVMSELKKWNLQHKSAVPDRKPRKQGGNRKKTRLRRR